MTEPRLPLLYVHKDWIFYPSAHQHNLIEELKKNPERQERMRKIIKKGKGMNFQQAIAATKEGKQVRRPAWEPTMYMWWSGVYSLHTHPYFDFQGKAASLAGYFYVVEKDDATAKDWEEMRA